MIKVLCWNAKDSPLVWFQHSSDSWPLFNENCDKTVMSSYSQTPQVYSPILLPPKLPKCKQIDRTWSVWDCHYSLQIYVWHQLFSSAAFGRLDAQANQRKGIPEFCQQKCSGAIKDTFFLGGLKMQIYNHFEGILYKRALFGLVI